jgi:hypothetical protein
MTIKNDVNSLLAQAQDPATTPKQLVSIWDSTTSSRVRKAIASNPNCDTSTLCMASRLYIKEVVENPSFELKTLFSEDPIVSDIYTAYTDPQGFWKDKVQRTKAKGPTHRAMLTSPSLDSWRIVEGAIQYLSSTDFARELKDPGVQSRVKRVVKSNINSFNISSLLSLLKNKVITIAEFSKALDHRRQGEFNLPYKSYCETFKTIRDRCNYVTLFKFVLASSNYSLKHLIKSLKDDNMRSYLSTDGCLVDLSNLYKDLLACEVAQNREHSSKGSGYYWSRPSFNDNKQSYYLSHLVWDLICVRNDLSLPNLNLDKLFSDIKMVGFHKDYGPYKCRLKFKELNLLTGRNDMCQKLLNLVDDLAFEFFMTSGVLWDEWYAKAGQQNLETMVMERMHRVNENTGGKYYKESLLTGYYPSVRISCQNGVLYDKDLYYDTKSTRKFYGSGLVSTS